MNNSREIPGFPGFPGLPIHEIQGFSGIHRQFKENSRSPGFPSLPMNLQVFLLTCWRGAERSGGRRPGGCRRSGTAGRCAPGVTETASPSCLSASLCSSTGTCPRTSGTTPLDWTYAASACSVPFSSARAGCRRRTWQQESRQLVSRSRFRNS